MAPKAELCSGWFPGGHSWTEDRRSDLSGLLWKRCWPCDPPEAGSVAASICWGSCWGPDVCSDYAGDSSIEQGDSQQIWLIFSASGTSMLTNPISAWAGPSPNPLCVFKLISVILRCCLLKTCTCLCLFIGAIIHWMQRQLICLTFQRAVALGNVEICP